MGLVTGFNIITLAYSYHINLFPTYNSLGHNKSTKTGMTAIAYASLMSFIIYVSLGIISIYMFGSSLDVSVISNVDKEKNIYSYIVRLAFMIVLACHIPYVFLPTKEGLLIIFDEFKNKSMEKMISEKVHKDTQVFEQE